MHQVHECDNKDYIVIDQMMWDNTSLTPRVRGAG